MKDHVIAAFSEDQVEQLTGVSKPQLRYWARTGFYRPSYDEGRRAAFSRAYSFKDVVALRVLNVLRNDHGVSLQHLRDVSERLGGMGADPSRWTKYRLYPLNRRVVWREPGSDLPQDVASRQYVVSVVLHDVVHAIKARIDDLRIKRPRSDIGLIRRSRYIAHNAAVVAGTRIPVSVIKSFRDAGYTVAQIIREYPDLKPADVRAALRYQASSSAA